MTYSEIMKQYVKEHNLKVVDVKLNRNMSLNNIKGIPYPEPVIKIIQL